MVEKAPLSARAAQRLLVRQESTRERGNLGTVCALIRKSRIALLTTLDREGRFHTRPVQTLQADPDGTLWFFTDWNSPKAAELESDVRVSLGYVNLPGNTYVAISGVGCLLKDPDKARHLWSLEQRAFYPNGPQDSRLALLRVRIERAEYWIAPGRWSYWIAAACAWMTGRPTKVIGINAATFAQSHGQSKSHSAGNSAQSTHRD